MVVALSLRVFSFASLCSLSCADGSASCSPDDVDATLEEEALIVQVSLLSQSHQMFRFHVDDEKEATIDLTSKVTHEAIKEVLEQEFLSDKNSDSVVHFMERVRANEVEQETIATAVVREFARTDKMFDSDHLKALEEEVKKVAAEEEINILKVEGDTESFFPDIAKVLHNDSGHHNGVQNLANLDVVVSQAIETEFKTMDYYGTHHEYLDYLQDPDSADEQEDVAKIVLKELTGLQVDPNDGPEMELLREMEGEVVKVAVDEELLEQKNEEVAGAEVEVAHVVSDPVVAAAEEIAAEVAEMMHGVEVSADLELDAELGAEVAGERHGSAVPKVANMNLAQHGSAESQQPMPAAPMAEAKAAGFSVAKEATAEVTGFDNIFGMLF